MSKPSWKPHPCREKSSSEILDLFHRLLKNPNVTWNTMPVGDMLLYVFDYKKDFNPPPDSDEWTDVIWARGCLFGLNTDKTRVVITPYPIEKFFSHHVYPTMKTLSGKGEMMCEDKSDGTLLYLMAIAGKVIAWTRSGFKSVQSQTLWKDTLGETGENFILQHPLWLFGFELIHQRDPKVQANRDLTFENDSGDQERYNRYMVLIHTVTDEGLVAPRNQLAEIASCFGLNTVRAIELTKTTGADIEEKQKQPFAKWTDVHEGWIVWFDGERFKVKRHGYVILANGLPHEGKSYKLVQPTRQAFRKEMDHSKTMIGAYKMYCIRPPKGTTDVPEEVYERFEEELGASLMNDMGNHWGRMVQELESYVAKTTDKVEEALALASPSKTIDALDKKSLGPIFGLVRFVIKTIGDNAFDKNLRDNFYNTPGFQNKVFPMIKKEFKVHQSSSGF